MSRTLLLADGSVTIQRVVELTFAHEDIRVTAVADGRKAIQMLESEQPDVVLADVDLAEVDGYALAAHMRRVPRLKNVPVLLLAGAFEPVDQEKARDVGSDGVIIKPFEPQVIVTRVKELIDQRDRGNAAKAAKDDEAAADARPTPKPVAVPAPEKESPRGAKPDAAFPRAADEPAPATPAPETPAAPEPLELPSRPIWDVRGSVVQPGGGGPLGSIPLPPLAGAAPAVGPHQPPAPPAPAAPKVTLASAFTALLAAEQSVPAAAAPPVALTEASIEDAVRRVLVRMTDDLVRRIVVDTAERLIREEIERIKATPD